MTRILAARVDTVMALDISTPSLAVVKAMNLPNVQTTEVLIEHYEPSIKFDWIVMSEVLEHLRNPAKVLGNCVGWLRPGGSLLVTTPHGHWESNEHLQEFTLERFAAMLAATGAEEIMVSYLRDIQDRRRWLVGRVAAASRPPVSDDFNDRRRIASTRGVAR